MRWPCRLLPAKRVEILTHLTWQLSPFLGDAVPDLVPISIVRQVQCVFRPGPVVEGPRAVDLHAFVGRLAEVGGLPQMFEVRWVVPSQVGDDDGSLQDQVGNNFLDFLNYDIRSSIQRTKSRRAAWTLMHPRSNGR